MLLFNVSMSYEIIQQNTDGEEGGTLIDEKDW